MAEETYLDNPETGSRFRLAGLEPPHEPSNLPKFFNQREYPSGELPPSVDLRELMTTVEQQGEMGAW